MDTLGWVLVAVCLVTSQVAVACWTYLFGYRHAERQREKQDRMMAIATRPQSVQLFNPAPGSLWEIDACGTPTEVVRTMKAPDA